MIRDLELVEPLASRVCENVACVRDADPTAARLLPIVRGGDAVSVSDPRLQPLLPQRAPIVSANGSMASAYARAALSDLDRSTLAVLVAVAMGGSLDEVAEHMDTPRPLVLQTARSGLRAVREHDPSAWRRTVAWFREAIEDGGTVLEAGPALEVDDVEIAPSMVWAILTRVVRRYENLHVGTEPVADGAAVVYDGMHVRRDALAVALRGRTTFLSVDEAAAVDGVPRGIVSGAPWFFDGVGMTIGGSLYSREWSVDDVVRAVAEALGARGPGRPDFPGAAELAELIEALLPNRRHEATEARVAALLTSYGTPRRSEAAPGDGGALYETPRSPAANTFLRSEGGASTPSAFGPPTNLEPPESMGSVSPTANEDDALAEDEGTLDDLERAIMRVLVDAEEPLTAGRVAAALDRPTRLVRRALQGPLADRRFAATSDGRRFAAARPAGEDRSDE